MADVLLDACCLINLCSSGRLREILSALPHRWHVCTAVSSETLFVEALSGGHTVRSQVNLEAWFDSGLFHRCAPDTPDELAGFVAYATQLDDGEAMCLAIAKSRSWIVATDERKGRRIAENDGIRVMNTIELVKSWSETSAAESAAIIEVVRNITMLGRYRPSSGAPGVQWWRRHSGG